MSKRLVSIVIPLFNEEQSLPDLVHALRRLAVVSSYSFEFIFVDDGSTDSSFMTLANIRKKTHARMVIIRLRTRHGKSTALSVGFAHAKGIYVVTMDADLQDDPAEVPSLLGKLDSGYDLVVGWRKRRHDPSGKIRASRIFNTIVSRLGRVQLHDMNCGLKALRIDVARDIRLYGELHRFFPVLAAARGFSVTEIPVRHHHRKFGTSKYTASRVLHAFFDLLTTVFLISFSDRPLKIFGPVGIGMIGTGTGILFYLSVLHFLGESIGKRPLLLFGVMLVLFGIQLVSTGLIGELIVDARSKRDTASVREIIGPSNP